MKVFPYVFDPFYVNFCIRREIGVQFLLRLIPVSPAPLVERTVLSPGNGLGSLSEDLVAVNVVVSVQALCSVPSAYMSVLMPGWPFF